MTKLLEEAIAKVRELPETEQDAAAGALIDYVEALREIQLTDEQMAEVGRRISNPYRRTVSLVEARERLRKFGA